MPIAKLIDCSSVLRPCTIRKIAHIKSNDNLMHYGIKGMKWGVRRKKEQLAHDRSSMLNYYNRTIEPIISAIVDEMKRKFLTKTARSQNKSIMFFRDPFKLVPVADLAEISDKFTRNEIATSNEIRQVIGWKPSADPKADELRNSNLSEPGGSVTDVTNGNETDSSTDDYDALVNEVLDSISAQIDDIIGNYTSGDSEEGDDS